MVAAGIYDRIRMNEIIIRRSLEPEAELLRLCAGALYHITAVKDNIRVIVLHSCIQLCTCRENMGIRQ